MHQQKTCSFDLTKERYCLCPNRRIHGRLPGSVGDGGPAGRSDRAGMALEAELVSRCPRRWNDSATSPTYDGKPRGLSCNRGAWQPCYLRLAPRARRGRHQAGGDIDTYSRARSPSLIECARPLQRHRTDVAHRFGPSRSSSRAAATHCCPTITETRSFSSPTTLPNVSERSGEQRFGR
ncbi:hypothetical protein SAMN05421819_4321 [Bryocella elongata]|uniref:Uncharacterized protein n=1 Tax=Bryocella elongata TaxID=863522 RepID=A0A1H6C8E5_9BACT|nr:hypothetical protein SAMN05421819_4321 [Bryocella elongata]